MRAGVGLSEAVRTQDAALEAADLALKSGPMPCAQLAIVFASAEHSPGYREMLATLHQRLDCKAIVGCSAAGVMAGDMEVEARPAVAVLALASATLQPRTFLVRDTQRPVADIVQNILSQLGAKSFAGSTLMLFADPEVDATKSLLEMLGPRLPGVTIVGGGASGLETGKSAFVMGQGEAISKAIAGVLIPDQTVGPGVTQSCLPVGSTMLVTRTQERVILEVDGAPALGTMSRLLHCADVEGLAKLGGRAFLGLAASKDPAQLVRAEYAVRPIVGLYPDQGGIGIPEPVSVGQPICFLLREPIRARDDLRRMLGGVTQQLGKRKSAAMLYVNCVARGRALHGYEGVDSSMIRRAMGPVPAIGWFSSFEIAPRSVGSAMVTYTGVLIPIV